MSALPLSFSESLVSLPRRSMVTGSVTDSTGVRTLSTSSVVIELIELLTEKGIRDKFKVILGGAPVTRNWAEKCGADGFAPNAIEAIDLAKSLLNIK